MLQRKLRSPLTDPDRLAPTRSACCTFELIIAALKMLNERDALAFGRQVFLPKMDALHFGLLVTYVDFHDCRCGVAYELILRDMLDDDTEMLGLVITVEAAQRGDVQVFDATGILMTEVSLPEAAAGKFNLDYVQGDFFAHAFVADCWWIVP